MSGFIEEENIRPVHEIVHEIEDRENRYSVANTPQKIVGVPLIMKTPKMMESDRKKSPPKSVTSTAKKHSAREAARLAKLQSTAEKAKRVSALKEKWAKDKERKSHMYKSRKEMERNLLNQSLDEASEKRKMSSTKKESAKRLRQASERELLQSSLQDRLFQAEQIEMESKARRRISIFLNKKMQKLATERASAIKSENDKLEKEHLEDRRINYLKAREYKEKEAQRRRESLAMRGKTAQIQKKKAEELEILAENEDRIILEMRYHNHLDDKALKERDEQLRRESMHGRIEEWRAQKDIIEELTEQEKEKRQLDFWLKREDAKDVEGYKEKEQLRDRQSLAGRLNKWREERQVTVNLKQQEIEAAAIDVELKKLDREAINLAKEKSKKNRRDSLAYRLNKAKKDKDFDAGQKALAVLVEEEERRLQALDRKDVENYKEKMAEARRQSLQYRNQAAFQDRMRLEGEEQKEQANIYNEIKLNEQEWDDVRTYREQLRDEARKSIAWRVADAKRQQEITLTQHQENLEKLRLDIELRRLDWNEVKHSAEESREKSRKSIEMRLESWKQYRLQEEVEKNMLEREKEEEAYLREQDREAMLQAKIELEMMERKNLTSSSDITL